MKIKTKFSVASGLVVFIVISLLALSTYMLVERTLEEKTTAYIKDNTVLLTGSISNWLKGKSSQIQIIKTEVENDFSPEKFQHALNNQALTHDFSLMFGTLAEETILRSNDINRISPTEIDFRQRPWFTLAQGNNGINYTAPYIDAATGELLLSVVTAINTNSGFKGVLGGDLSLDSIANSVNTINFNSTGLAFIADSSGKIITHPNSQFNNKTTQQIYGQSPKNALKIIEIMHEDHSKLLYFMPLESNSGVDWNVAVLLDKSKVYESLSTFTFQTFIFAIISIALCVFVLGNLAKRLLTPLESLEKAIKEIASGGGDLTQRMNKLGDDECGVVAQNFNVFLGSLQKLVKNIKDKATNVMSKSDEAQGLSTQSSESLSNQYLLIDNLATAMNEMSATSSDIASSAQEAASSVTAVNETAESSKSLFSKTSQDVIELSQSITDSQELSNQLAEYSGNIEQILSVINAVAEQTNLLALNAAIEAARAGEHGRGFAVVADEVRTLASRTQESTTEIKSMIAQIQQYSSQVQQAMNLSKDKATGCVEHTEIANQSLDTISNAVKDIMDRNIQIAAAIEEQSVVIEEINKNTTEIKDISMQVDEFSQEQFNTNTDLVNEVQSQHDLLGKFVV